MKRKQHSPQRNSLYSISGIRSVLIIFSLALTSCFDSPMDEQIRFVEPQLKPYVDSFIEEAAARGVSIDASQLTISFGTHDGAAYAVRSTNTIVVDSTSYDWVSGLREQLVYHELGHLYLGREHDDDMIGNYPKSIMAGVEDPWDEGRQRQRLGMRKYYIDELFNPDTKRPDWSL